MGQQQRSPGLAMGPGDVGERGTHGADLVGRGAVLQQQCHHVRVALLRCLVQRGIAQLQGRTEGAAISYGCLWPQKCPPKPRIVLRDRS